MTKKVFIGRYYCNDSFNKKPNFNKYKTLGDKKFLKKEIATQYTSKVYKKIKFLY